MKEENKTEYAYIETPVSEKPLKAGNYICILEGDEGDYSEEILFNGETWHEWEDSTAEYDEPCENIKFWLKKVPIPQIQELESWKRQAIEVMPDFQEIGKLLNVPLGQSVHDKIIPFIKKVVAAKVSDEAIEQMANEIFGEDSMVGKGFWIAGYKAALQ